MKVTSLKKLTNNSAQAVPLNACEDTATMYKQDALLATDRGAAVSWDSASRGCCQSRLPPIESTTKRDYDEANPPVNAILLATCFKLAVYG